MKLDEYKKALLDIVLHYGEISQMHICIEECAELSKALLKYERYIDDGCHTDALKDNIIGELADVAIMLIQMVLLFNCEDEVKKFAERTYEDGCDGKVFVDVIDAVG